MEVDEIVFSPDGRTIGSVHDALGEDSRAWFWDVTTGEGRTVECSSARLDHLAFSPDSKTLAGICNMAGIYLVPDDVPGNPSLLAASLGRSTSAMVAGDRTVTTPP
jgi:hypothetical protein